MQEQMNKAKLLENIRQERQRLESTLVGVGADLMVTPGVTGDWAVKDILAHITVWEQRMLSWLGDALQGKVPQMLPPGMTWDDLDEWNEQTYQKHRHRPLGDVLADFAMSYPQALKAIQEVPEEDLIDPDRFEWREERPLWVMVAANTSWHYKEHNESISAWLEGMKAA